MTYVYDSIYPPNFATKFQSVCQKPIPLSIIIMHSPIKPIFLTAVHAYIWGGSPCKEVGLRGALMKDKSVKAGDSAIILVGEFTFWPPRRRNLWPVCGQVSHCSVVWLPFLISMCSSRVSMCTKNCASKRAVNRLVCIYSQNDKNHSSFQKKKKKEEKKWCQQNKRQNFLISMSTFRCEANIKHLKKTRENLGHDTRYTYYQTKQIKWRRSRMHN